MAIRSLPPRPSLEHLRNEAREVQRRVRAGDERAPALAREFHHRFAQRADSFRVSDAQLTIARAGWAKHAHHDDLARWLHEQEDS